MTSDRPRTTIPHIRGRSAPATEDHPSVDWRTVFRPRPLATPRPLTASDLRAFVRHGLDLSLALTCCDCGMSVNGVYHKDVCARQRPNQARTQPRQPWEPRPATRAA